MRVNSLCNRSFVGGLMLIGLANIAAAQYPSYPYLSYFYTPQFQYTPPGFVPAPYGIPPTTGFPYTPPPVAPTPDQAAAQEAAARKFLGLESSNSLAKYDTGTQQANLNREQARMMEASAAPHRLTAAQFDRTHDVIFWPMELRTAKYDDVRYRLDKLFHERTPANSGEGSKNSQAVEQACNEMQELLKSDIKELPPMQYISVQQFIRSVAYEARFAKRA